MDCAYHPGVAAVGYCSGCAKPACQTCMTSREGRSLCPVCAAALPVAPVPAPAPATSEGGGKTGLLAGIGCCGIVILIALIVGGIAGYRWYQGSLQASESQAKTEADKLLGGSPKAPVADPKPVSSGTPATPVAKEPGEQRAVDAALQDQPAWKWRVMYRTDDWQRAKVWIGPTDANMTTEVILQWNSGSGSYTVERKGAIPKQAEGPSPSRSRAIAAAKGGHGGWVAKVVSHTGDWTRARIWLGPPASEFYLERTVQWTGHGYSIVSERGIEQEAGGVEDSEEAGGVEGEYPSDYPEQYPDNGGSG